MDTDDVGKISTLMRARRRIRAMRTESPFLLMRWSVFPVAAKGYRIDVPFGHNRHLAHGLSALFQPRLAAELSDDLRANCSLFSLYWQER